MSFQVPTHLLSSAYFSLNGEPAWPRHLALEVIDCATASGVAVLGVEIWLPTHPGPTIPTPYIYTFETEQLKNEEWSRFLVRANDAAAHYVREFDWDPADRQHHALEPYFNLLFGGR